VIFTEVVKKLSALRFDLITYLLLSSNVFSFYFFNPISVSFVFSSQMFMAITNLVLRSKKEQKERQVLNSDTVNIRKHTTKPGGKKKCC
jgi:hypothetical protein